MVISLAGLVDIENEKDRLLKELQHHKTNETKTKNRLKNKQFTSKAPEEVIQREEERLAKILERQERLTEIIKQLN